MAAATTLKNSIVPHFEDPLVQVGLVLVLVVLILVAVFVQAFANPKYVPPIFRSVQSYARFAYTCFFKPHSGDSSRNQQDALESFYKAQASVYDATRKRLLRGREDMLGLVASQMKNRIEAGILPSKPVWVDMGGGTGYNIEAMSQFVNVPTFFKAVYLVDLSPSLCRIAEARFERLGWTNVKVVCQDARHFKIQDHGSPSEKSLLVRSSPVVAAFNGRPVTPPQQNGGVELITMSYSLSMIPEFYPVIDSISALLAPNGVIGVSDFYVQSEVDYQSRNYTGGEIDRHCMWISRVFWRTWFEVDRVSLEAARRDYLEYRFGTILSFNARCHLLGLRIPYYVWVGCSKNTATSQLKLAELNAAATESPFLSALDLQSKAVEDAQRMSAIEVRSKAYESAVINLQSSLPLPSSWYQSHHWRIYYDESLKKHKQFKDEYIYAFTWEDALVDIRLLKIQQDDVILAITSAGDNILAYATESPKRIHAVDLNPNQNHLLELKMAAFTALPYADVWKLFGEGKHPNFRQLLIEKLSPHLSSLAFQYWLHHGHKAFSGKGLYFTGGSRHALKLTHWVLSLVGLREEVKRFCSAQTLNEQREIWNRSIRRVLLSRLLSWTIISNKAWLWRALGVPNAQREMIERDYLRRNADPPSEHPSPMMYADHGKSAPSSPSSSVPPSPSAEYINFPISSPREAGQGTTKGFGTGAAIWEYCTSTLDPVASSTLLSTSNHYYLLALLGHYTRTCHPVYLTPRSHVKLSQPQAFDGLRIHTDEVAEVVERMTPGTLTIAVLMDSMDWFDRNSSTDVQNLRAQVRKVNTALKLSGRVMIRSAGEEPWYVALFEEEGFTAKRVARRVPGTCIDRVNMYASTWIFTKMAEVSILSSSSFAAADDAEYESQDVSGENMDKKMEGVLSSEEESSVSKRRESPLGRRVMSIDPPLETIQAQEEHFRRSAAAKPNKYKSTSKNTAAKPGQGMEPLSIGEAMQS